LLDEGFLEREREREEERWERWVVGEREREIRSAMAANPGI